MYLRQLKFLIFYKKTFLVFFQKFYESCEPAELNRRRVAYNSGKSLQYNPNEYTKKTFKVFPPRISKNRLCDIKWPTLSKNAS